MAPAPIVHIEQAMVAQVARVRWGKARALPTGDEVPVPLAQLCQYEINYKLQSKLAQAE